MNYAVIMAGGSGKRLWPLSRQKRPKQVLRLFDGQTLLRKCFERLIGVFDVQNIIVLTNANYVDTVREDLSELSADNVIAEPVIRDTASAIGLAATILHKKDPDAKMAVVTADQILEPADSFRQAMAKALSFIDENPHALLTFGISPTLASTQLGYLKFGKPKPCAAAGNEVCAIEAFKEKPDERTAGQYLKEGCYFWNSGLFVWRCETILNLLKKFVPGGTEPLNKIRADWGGPNQQQTLQEWFPRLPKISIDYAVMEKAQQVYGIKLQCRWLDLGSFAALRDIITSDNSSNIVVCEHYQLLDSRNNIVITEEKGHLLAMIGIENMIVAHTKDATLVCPIDQADRLKELLEKIENRHQGKFL
jgi:mannose-1-phosphate guanylyltransferase